MKKFVKCTAVTSGFVIASAVLAHSSNAEEVEISGSADGSIRIVLDTEDILVRAGVIFAYKKVFPLQGDAGSMGERNTCFKFSRGRMNSQGLSWALIQT